MFALMFALARMASAAWVGAAVLFVVVAINQTRYFSPPKEASNAPSAYETDAAQLPPHLRLDNLQRKHVVAEMALVRFPLYYYAGGSLLGISLFSAAFLRRRYLKASRWSLVMLLLLSAGAFLAYDWQKVYKPLHWMTQRAAANPAEEVDPLFETLHEHSKQVNGAQLLLTFLASLLLCLPGTRPEPTVVMVKKE